MNELKKISIVIPIYNKEKYIENLMNSIEKQTYRNYEVIIINDGSTDKSLEICKKMAERNNHIKIISQQNQGPSNARNTGIQNATGENIVFIDADDILEENYLEELVKYSSEYDLTICGYRLYEETKNKMNINVYSAKQEQQELEIREIMLILKKNLLNNLWNKIFKTEIIKKNNIKFIPEISLGEDTLFVLEYMKHIKTKIKVINIPLYSYMLRKSGINLGSKEKIEERIKRLLYTKNQASEVYRIHGINDYKIINDEFLIRIIPIMARYIIKEKNDKIAEKRKKIRSIICFPEMEEMITNTNHKFYGLLIKKELVVIAYLLLRVRRKEKNE